MFQTGQPPRQRQLATQACLSAFLEKRVQGWYPNWSRTAYFLPPIFMNRTQHRPQRLAEQFHGVTHPPTSNLPAGSATWQLQESAVRDDECQRLVLDCLHKLAQTEVMFVISQLQFGDYLSPSYAAAASMFNRPIDLKLQNKHQGDFDVLLIHRKYGILVGEIKAIGDKLSGLSQTQQDQQLKKKVEQSITQLQKADDVLKHLVSDLQTAPRIQKTLMLPNITKAQLQRVLADNPQLRQVRNSWTANALV